MKWYKNIRTSKHDHIKHILDVSKAIGFTNKQFNFDVDRLNSGIAQFAFYSIEDMLLMTPNFIGKLFENLNSAVSSSSNEGV